MTPDSALVALARTTAVQYSLTPSLVCAQIEQESDWDRLAVRLEERFYLKYIRDKVEAGQISPAEGVLRSTSIGLMQVMLETARELGYSGSFDDLAADPHLQIVLGCKKLARRVDANHGDIVAALLEYNGGADPLYPRKVISKAASYTV